MITKTELRYTFEVTTKPQIDSGRWIGHGKIEYVDESLTFEFWVHRDGRTGRFNFEAGGDPAIEERVKSDLLRTLAQCYDFAVEQAAQRFAADLYDGGAGIVDA